MLHPSLLAPQIDVARTLIVNVPVAPGIDVEVEIDTRVEHRQRRADTVIFPRLLLDRRLASHAHAAPWTAAAGAAAKRGRHAARWPGGRHDYLMLGDQGVNQRQRRLLVLQP